LGIVKITHPAKIIKPKLAIIEFAIQKPATGEPRTSEITVAENSINDETAIEKSPIQIQIIKFTSNEN
jgi:hypothetical protein